MHFVSAAMDRKALCKVLLGIVVFFLASISIVKADAATNGNISFVTNHVYVQEKIYEEAVFNLKREDGKSGLIFLACKILNSTNTTDFVDISSGTSFPNGGSSSSCIFTVVEDSIPEPDITYSVGISIISGGAIIGSPSIAHVTILANDDPYGNIGFQDGGQRISINEPLQGQEAFAMLNISRRQGTIGRVVTFWQVSPGLNAASVDISPTTGMVTFENGENLKSIRISVLPDNIAEKEEQFSIQLVNVTGGAKINATLKSIVLIIPANDPPIQFTQSTIAATELTTISVTVTRGISNGEQIGSVLGISTVSYTTVDGTAKAGIDYQHQSGLLTFNNGVTMKSFNIVILKDSHPEIMENFTIVLSSPSADSILGVPNVLVVNIAKNDDPHGVISFYSQSSDAVPTIILNEDGISSSAIQVNRSRGTFGTIVVDWRVVQGTGETSVPFDVFDKVNGSLIFQNGISAQNITLNAKNDQVASEAKEFYLELYNVNGGARFASSSTGFPRIKIIIQDSDNAYGVVYFGNQSENRVILSSTPRRVMVSLHRSGGTFGPIRINYTAIYLLSGSSIPSSSVQLIYPGILTMLSGVRNSTIVIQIAENSFLKNGAVILVRINSAAVQKSTIVSPQSPLIGSPRNAYMNITTQLANGEISFFNNPINIAVNELNDNYKISLQLMRDGTANIATVYWRLIQVSNTLTISDVSPWSGVVIFHQGSDRMNLTITIHKDDIPELDESFIVELTNVTEKNEKLRVGATRANVKINKNDNPGGTFEFSFTGPLILQENQFFTLDVVRRGGRLTVQRVKVEIKNGKDDFTVYQTIFKFNPEEIQKSFYVYPIDDNIPEINETFEIVLTSIDGSILGSNTLINITILQNDDANGVFSFVNSQINLNKKAVEMKESFRTVSFDITRERGSFGFISVFWNVTSLSKDHPSFDIQPLNGNVDFPDGIRNRPLDITIKPDRIPESEEMFRITLINATGRAKLKSPLQALLTINQNDAPIYFLNPSNVKVNEGQIANLTIILNRTLSSNIDVIYSTSDITASASAGDYVGLTNHSVTFMAGERSKIISIQTIDDNISEISETFNVRLVASTGDTVLIHPLEATVTIEPNDDPYGVFEFSSSSLYGIASEGDIVSLGIQRNRGTYKNVTVDYEVLSNAKTPIAKDSEFTNTKGSVVFNQGSSIEYLNFQIRKDNVPELNETFYIRLTNVSGDLTVTNGARLGNKTEAVILVLPSDDPSGVLEFAANSLEVSIAEDYQQGYINATFANLTVERKKGSFGSIQALWQLYKTSAVVGLPTRIWDLTFHSQKGNGVTEITGRNYSGTNAFDFNNANDSYLFVPQSEQPPTSLLSSGFSLSMWVKPKNGSKGTLLSKRKDISNSLLLMVNLNSQASNPIVIVHISNDNYNFSLAASTNLFNGNWHSLILTLSSTTALLFVDGAQIESKTLLNSVKNSVGYIYIGCNLPSIDHYNGALQDVRLYTRVLTSAPITEISSMEKVTIPTNGYIKFDNFVVKKNIFLRTIDNNIPEQDTVYSLRLIDIKDGGKLATEITSRLTILKSDNANGQFAFESSNCITVAMENQTSLSFVVKRTIGSFGSVIVNWEIRQFTSSKPLASSDFKMAKGSVTFGVGQNEATITINPINDTIPEMTEKFELRLVSVVSTDGAIASTPNSGATIKKNFDTCNISILANDNPYGVLQISPKRPTGAGFIKPLAAPLSVNVNEEVGTVTLYVVRAQGVQGTVTCEWKTNALTARGNVDYTDAIGISTFATGVNITEITISILNNNIPELEKTFSVQLYNPTGGAVLGVASSINVTILPSDDAFGIFSFATSAKTIIVNEAQGTLQIEVIRQRGLFGPVRINWRLSNIASVDFGSTEGMVIFNKGESEKNITIPIIDDTIPELSEEFFIQLVNASKGGIDQSNKAIKIKIIGNDDPYGIFEFPSSPMRLTESNRTVNIVISRQNGLIGNVRVFYQTVASSTAVANLDYAPVSSNVLFTNGQQTAIVNVTIFDDNYPEPDETVLVNLTKVVLLNGTEILDNTPRIGNNRIATLIINANDNANGILQFSSSSVTVHEGITGKFLNLTRTGGAFSQVSVRFNVQDKEATIGSDFTVSSFEISLNIGQTSAVVPISIINDNQPEFAESFVITLIDNSVTGGAMIGSPNQCIVTISENDYPYGFIGFASGSLNKSIEEPSSGSATAILTVIRNGGTSGTVQVEWNATLNGHLASSDLTQSKGSVRFLSGENTQDITLSIIADDIPEDNEAINVNLQYVSNGKATIDASSMTAVLNILPNDDPYGIIQFVQASFMAQEKDIDYNILLNVSRTKGLFGTVKVYYRTKDAISASNKASSGSDYESANDKSIQLGPGEAYGIIQIKILKDDVPELDENFLVEITKAETVGITSSSSVKIGKPNVVNVTISANDQPYGLFSINIADTGTDGRTFAIIEPESGQTSINFEIKRTQGFLGSVSVSWRVAAGSTVNTTTDVSGVSGGRINFNQNELKKSFNIAVKSDSIPEVDEHLIIEIYDPSGGALIDQVRKQVTLTIKANDGVGGKIGFNSGSRSRTVKEGEYVYLSIYRTMPAAGNVSLNWTIDGVNASFDFIAISGKLFMKQGVQSSVLVLKTRNDSTPEINDQFTVRLSDPITFGVSSTGAAVLVSGDSTATIIIGASDEPHGIIEFAPISQPIKVKEPARIELRLIRKMGNIGDVVVKYQMQGISISQKITEAIEGEDFQTNANHSVIIKNGNDSGSIFISIINDTTPEQDEAFNVNITSVELKDGSNVTAPPKIGMLRSMQIQIEANDGTQGELAFATKFQRYTVKEDVTSFNITVIRHKGNFGDVYAFYYLNRLTASLSDFFIAGGVMNGPAKLTFANGQRERNITVFITNDNITEPDEQFEIGLTILNAVNNGGVTIGSPSKSLIIIAANDDANGVISFASKSIIQAITEPNTASSDNKTATFYIERKIGTFGAVNIRWQIIGVSNASDVSPVNGLVTFAANDKEKSFQISALQDDIPELNKKYTIELTVISGGARVGNPSQAILIVAANDNPNGLFNIRSYPSLSNSLNIEETSKSIKTVIQRSGGHIGTVSVRYTTNQGSAISNPGMNLYFGFYQMFNTKSAESFHSFSAYGKAYLLLASSFRKKIAGTVVSTNVIEQQFESTLFRWQGAFVPILTLLTDGAVKWKSFEINNEVFLFSVNHGTQGRYQTFSQLFKFNSNETLQLVQNISTKGASDAVFFKSNVDDYLLILNQIDNNDRTNLQTQLLKWQGNQFSLESSSLSTSGALSLVSFSIGNSMYVAIANNYDSAGNTFSTSSSVYLWSSGNRRFTLSQSIQTQGAHDVDYVDIDGESYLFFTNSRSVSRLYRYKSTIPSGFIEVQEISVANAKTGKFFKWNQTVYLVIAANESVLFKWDGNSKQFQNLTKIPARNAVSIVPFNATDSISGTAQLLAVAVSDSSNSFILRLAMLSGNADFVSRNGELTFYDGQSSISLDFTVLKDTIPEMDETFSIDLSNPTGGAKLAPNSNLQVNILSNDNAYGRLAFMDSSLRINITEKQWDSVLTLDIIREFGSFGQVSVNWNISSSTNHMITDLYPISGQINLNQGVSRGSINVYIKGDEISELDETFQVRLTSVAMTGTPNANRGPTINHLKNNAMVTILANDDPYGVIQWKNRIEVTTEQTEVNSSALLVISRQFGTLGDILINYETVQASSVAANERIAIPGIDYFSKKSSILMKQGRIEALVYIEVRHDNNTNVNEIFYVNITNASLVSGSLVPNSPRINTGKNQVEVVITENVLNRGIIEFASSDMIRIAESVGMVTVRLHRFNGSEGTVGVHFKAIGINASSADFFPQDGLITFSNNSTDANLNISIVDDGIAELNEIFSVTLTKPSGGVKLGVKRTIQIVIEQNDYPYGIFSFSQASRNVPNATEGSTVVLTVNRKQGVFRHINVDWSCGSQAQSDLQPWFGTLNFAENATQAKITINIINDNIPEIAETFTCTLIRANNGAVVSSENTANITIVANDKPHGVISIDSKSRSIAVSEPIISSGYNGNFSIFLQRSVGFDGLIEVNWKLQPVIGNDNPAETFNSTSGRVVFPSGNSMQRINLEVKDDNIAEESKIYILSLESVVGGAELDSSINSTKSYITVVSSEQPYGVIQFLPPLSLNVTERSGFVNLTIVRSIGFIGQLRVKYDTSSTTAMPAVDYSPTQGEILFNSGETVKSIQINISNDEIPELTETFSVNITDVQLITSRKMNYGFVNGLQIDVPPNIGSQSSIVVSINENDNPYGTIEFIETSRLAHERDGRIMIAVNRTDGSFGSSTVYYTYNAMNASYPDDFTVDGTSLTFTQGDKQKFITVNIINDKISEFQEKFSLDLTSVTGNANLGLKKRIIVTIETSDNPYGLFGIFNTSLSISIANPDSGHLLSFPLSRIDGVISRSEVKWRLIRQTQSSSSITEDITPATGTVIFEVNERGPKPINITVLPFGGPQEPEEKFVLNVYSASAGASLDHSAVNVTITILKKGHPNGLFSFEGVVTPSTTVNEPQSGSLKMAFPVLRNEGTIGNVHLTWTISSLSGSIGQDITIANTTLSFGNGEARKNILIEVIADDIPELNEVYKVVLTSSDNGAEINAARNTINFTVLANDYPHGLFQLSEVGKRFDFNASSLSRTLHFTVERKKGTFGSVQANIILRYSADSTTDTTSVTFHAGQNNVDASFAIPSGRFLMFGANFTIHLQSVTVLTEGSSMAPAVNASSPTITIVIPELAANSILQFDSNSRMVSASESLDVTNVVVSRHGLFGVFSVNWRSGYPRGSFAIGTIMPSTGSLSFAQGERTKSFSFKATVPSVLQNNLIYAVYLSSVSLAIGQPAWPKIGLSNTAIVDAHGVLEISQNSRSVTVTEGNKVSVEIRRVLSTMGRIRVHYATQRYAGSNAATENIDFSAVSTYIDMNEGQTIARIQVNTIDDSSSIPERDELFYIQLTSVEVIPSLSSISSTSPRLSNNKRSTITIRDNDSPFGIISFTTQSNQIITQESSRFVTLNLQRSSGVFSTATVLIRTIGGGETWETEILNNLPSNSPIKTAMAARRKAASALRPNQDYLPLNQEISFQELNTIPSGGQTKSVNLTILQDSVSEAAEQIIIVLSNATGGARLPSISDNMQAFSVVTIDGNGLWNGEIGFTTGKSSINEDNFPQVTIPLQRIKGSAEMIEVKWNAWSPNINLANQLVKTSGNTSFAAGKSTSSITVMLKKDIIPEFSSWFYVNLTTNAKGTIIAGISSSLFAYCNVSVAESDYPAGRIGFDSRYSYPVVDYGDRTKQLRIRRYNGTLKDVTIRYQTISLISVINEGGVIMTPAIENKDFVSAAGLLNFPKGSTEAFVNLQFTPESSSAGSYPKVLNVTLFSPTNGAVLHESYKSDQVIIAKDSQTATFLRLRSKALKRPLSDTEIENILKEMLIRVKRPPLNENSQSLMMTIIRQITAYKRRLPAGSKELTNSSKNILLDVFDSLLSSSRTDSRGKSAWAVLLDELAYDFLNEAKCPFSFTGSRTNFALTSKRDQRNKLNGIKFSGKNADFFRYPVNMFSSSSSSCTDLHYIDYYDQQLFSSGKTVLNNKVMSSSIKSGLTTGMKIVYRVHTSKARVSKNGVSCVIWNHATVGSKGDWKSTNCKVKGEGKTYVECECQHLSQYAVLALSDNRTGYETYFLVSCFLCLSACFLALIAHHICAPETTTAANLLMHMIFAIMMTNILYVIAAYLSPSLMTKETDCGVLGIAIHYFFIAQFSWLFSQAYNLWRILVINDENTHRKYVQFFLIGWGIPVLIIAGYVFVTLAAYKWSFPMMYGDVHKNGDMCFIPNAYAAFGSVIVPVLLFILGAAIVFVQSYQVKPQWKCYDDIYRGRFNIKELRYLLILFGLLILTWLFAGLHLAYGYLWMIATFTAFNIILGLYILIQYAFIRNQMKYLCHGKYDVHTNPSLLLSNNEMIYAPGSLNASQRKLVDSHSVHSNRFSDWEDIDLPVNLEPIDMPDKGRASNRGHINESYDDDIESDEFDDLIFALKTGRGMSPSIQEEQELEEKPITPRATSTDQINVKRIKIADTHL